MSKYPEKVIQKEWIQNGITEDARAWAESFGKFLCSIEDDDKQPKGALSTSQLRKFFGEVKRIETDFEKYRQDLVMLKPMLSYAVGRDKKNKGSEFRNQTRIVQFEQELSKAIDFIRSDSSAKSDYKNFVKMFEAIVAYHKFYSKKDN
jgi:CRISPR-associated protein Csm2